MFRCGKNKRKKPYFMRHRWWYTKIPQDKRMSDYPQVDMALTKFASDKAKLVGP